MNVSVGIVCGACSRWSALKTLSCACGHSLLLERPALTRTSDAPATARDPVVEDGPSSLFSGALKRRDSSKNLPAAGEAIKPPPNMSLEEWMEQAKNFVCKACATAVPMGHKFCGRCGGVVPPEIVAARTQFFNQLQTVGRAKLILIRGDGAEGLSYQLNSDQHVVGREESDQVHLVFPDDRFVSPRHANLFYRGEQLFVKDEASINGVFLRVRGAIELAPGDRFLAGEQVFRVDPPEVVGEADLPDGTAFYASPFATMHFKITQLLEGGAAGVTICARAPQLQIGREGGDLNFPTDLYMSASHCKLEEAGGKITLTDLNSRNGTYVRLHEEHQLVHGDYIFIGRKLLRVEINAA